MIVDEEPGRWGIYESDDVCSWRTLRLIDPAVTGYDSYPKW